MERILAAMLLPGAVLLGAAQVQAQADGTPDARAVRQSVVDGAVGLQLENDAFGLGDDHYTQGFRAAFVLKPEQMPRLRNLARRVFDANRRFSIAAPRLDHGAGWATVFGGQSMFTPNKTLRDNTAYEDIADDRPYAGWLNAGIALHVPFDDGRGLKTVELTAGIVGPKSRAAETQTWWHRVIGVKPFLGWRNQLPSEPTAQVLFRSQQILAPAGPAPHMPGGIRTDMIWGYGASFGSPLTMAAASMQWRIGRSLPKDFGPPRIRPAISGFDAFAQADGGQAYAFGRVGAQAIAYNLFLDGNLFLHSPRVSKRPLVAEAEVGLVATLDRLTLGLVPGERVRVALTGVRRTREFDGPWGKVETFWSLSLSVLCRPEPRFACL